MFALIWLITRPSGTCSLCGQNIHFLKILNLMARGNHSALRVKQLELGISDVFLWRFAIQSRYI